MAFPLTAGDILRTRIVCMQGDQLGEVVLHYRVASVGSPAARDDDFRDVLDAAAAPLWKGFLSSRAEYIGVGVQHIWPLPLIVESNTRANAGAGTGGSYANPTQTCGLIHWRTVKAGRAYRGRSYLAFPSQSLNDDDGQPNSGAITAMGTMLGAIGGPFVITTGGRLATVVLTLWHRALHTYDDVLSGAASGSWATQRRRGAFGKKNAVPF